MVIIYGGRCSKNVVGFLNSGKDGTTESLQLFDFGFCRSLPISLQDDSGETFHMSLAGTTRYVDVLAISLSSTPASSQLLSGISSSLCCINFALCLKRYMAPEIMLYKPCNCVSDSYSWALTVYEMLTQKKPYDGVIREAHHFPDYVGEMQIRPNLNNLPEVPASLLNLLQHAWCASVDNRFTMQAIMDTLYPIISFDYTGATVVD